MFIINKTHYSKNLAFFRVINFYRNFIIIFFAFIVFIVVTEDSLVNNIINTDNITDNITVNNMVNNTVHNTVNNMAKNIRLIVFQSIQRQQKNGVTPTVIKDIVLKGFVNVIKTKNDCYNI
jgi:hypothetical protein